MFIIFIAHVPSNYWARFIPARFGPSDAAEMFVFCSGFAAAIAFGGTFLRSGFWMGSARIVIRCFQLYMAHIGLFFTIATICAAATAYFVEPNYINELNLGFFFDETGRALVGLFTLTYVPNLFDILPMYIGVLAMVPVVMVLARIHKALVLLFCATLYAAAWIWGWHFPAEPFSDREWFFNPFGWQLIFFTAFAISSGWIRAPKPNWALFSVCVVFVLALVPISNWPIMRAFPELKEVREFLIIGFKKTDFGLLRYIHFLALAYITVTLLKGREHYLKLRVFAPVIKTGQQALPVFLLSIALSWTGGIVLDQLGRDAWSLTLVNLTGILLLILCAYTMAWIKGTPWRRKPEAIAKGGRDTRPSQETVVSQMASPQAAE